jgi:hypothetical protein
MTFALPVLNIAACFNQLRDLDAMLARYAL